MIFSTWHIDMLSSNVFYSNLSIICCYYVIFYWEELFFPSKTSFQKINLFGFQIEVLDVNGNGVALA